MTEQGTSHAVNNWYILLHGLKLDAAEFAVAPGLTLVALTSPISVFDLAAVGAAGFREWATLEPLLPGCTCEIESAWDSEVVPGYDTLNRAWLASALIQLREFGGLMPLACNKYSWNTIAGNQGRPLDRLREVREGRGDPAVHQPRGTLPPFGGQLLDYHLYVMRERDGRLDAFNHEDSDWVRVNFERFHGLACENERFKFGLEAAVDWRYSKDPRTAISRLWGGIEAIFGINSELVFRLSLLAASILEPRGESRKTRFESIKRLYGLRSKAVHGEPLPEDRLNEAMNDSYGLLRDILLTIVSSGRFPTNADLDDAVFY